MKEVVKEVVLEANVGDPIVSGDAQKIKLGLISSPQFESEFELKLNLNYSVILTSHLQWGNSHETSPLGCSGALTNGLGHSLLTPSVIAFASQLKQPFCPSLLFVLTLVSLTQ